MVIWVIKIYFVQFSVYSCYLFLISSASVRSLLFLSFIVPIFSWNVPLVSPIFLRSLAFPILLFPSISLHCSLKTFWSFLAILWNSAISWVYLSFCPLCFTSLLFSTICKAFSDNHLAFFHFFFFGMVLVTASCTVSWASVHSSSGSLSSRSNPLNLLVSLHCNHKGFDLDHIWMA